MMCQLMLLIKEQIIIHGGYMTAIVKMAAMKIMSGTRYYSATDGLFSFIPNVTGKGPGCYLMHMCNISVLGKGSLYQNAGLVQLGNSSIGDYKE